MGWFEGAVRIAGGGEIGGTQSGAAVWGRGRNGIQGGTDSFYEYLAKAAILFDDKDCARMWAESLPAINKYLTDQIATGPGAGLWYGEADMNTGARTGTTYGALDAFFPALLVLSNEVDRAAQLQDSGYKMWNAAGIEPVLATLAANPPAQRAAPTSPKPASPNPALPTHIQRAIETGNVAWLAAEPPEGCQLAAD